MTLKLLIGAAVLTLVGLGILSSTSRPATPSPTPAAQAPPAPPPASGEERIELTQSALTDRLTQRLVGQPMGSTPLGSATLTRVSAQLTNGQMLTTGDAQVGSTSVPVSITGHMDLQSGRPLVIVQDARAAGVPLPDATRQAVQSAIQEQVDQEIGRSQLHVTSVTIGEGKLVVTGTRAR